MYKIKKNRLIITATLLAIVSSSLTTEASFAQSTPRVSRNEYTAQFPNPIKIEAHLKAEDLRHLPKINPTITFHYKSDTTKETQSIWTTPWDIVGALGTFVTIFYCNSEHPYVVATQAAMSLAAPVLPRVYNYMTGTTNPDSTNAGKE